MSMKSVRNSSKPILTLKTDRFLSEAEYGYTLF